MICVTFQNCNSCQNPSLEEVKSELIFFMSKNKYMKYVSHKGIFQHL